MTKKRGWRHPRRPLFLETNPAGDAGVHVEGSDMQRIQALGIPLIARLARSSISGLGLRRPEVSG